MDIFEAVGGFTEALKLAVAAGIIYGCIAAFFEIRKIKRAEAVAQEDGQRRV